MLAGEQPDLVRALVVADSGPARRRRRDRGQHVADYFDAWPKPFPSREAAIAHFGGPSLLAEMWADGLEERDGGLWPRWDAEVMTRTIREAFGRDYWEQWEAIGCPDARRSAAEVREDPSTGEMADAPAPAPRLVALDGATSTTCTCDRPDASGAGRSWSFLASLDRRHWHGTDACRPQFDRSVSSRKSGQPELARPTPTASRSVAATSPAS